MNLSEAQALMKAATNESLKDYIVAKITEAASVGLCSIDVVVPKDKAKLVYEQLTKSRFLYRVFFPKDGMVKIKIEWHKTIEEEMAEVDDLPAFIR